MKRAIIQTPPNTSRKAMRKKRLLHEFAGDLNGSVRVSICFQCSSYRNITDRNLDVSDGIVISGSNALGGWSSSMSSYLAIVL